MTFVSSGSIGLGGIGAGLGAVGSLLAPKKSAPQLQKHNFQDNFQGVHGTADAGGFQFQQDAGRQAAVDAANSGLAGLVQNVGQDGAATQSAATQAFLDPRLRNLVAAQGVQRQQMQDANAAKGVSGSSSALLGADLLRRAQGDQVSDLRNQAFFTGRQAADQDLNRTIQQLQALGGLSQQDFVNQSNAQAGALNAFSNQTQNEIARTNAINNIRKGQAGVNDSAKKANDPFSRVFSGGMGGFKLGQGIDDSLSSKKKGEV